MSFNSQRFSGPRRFGRSRGFSAQNRKPRSFDPSQIVGRASEVTAEEEFTPVHAFADFPLDRDLQRNIIERGYTQPTAIQDQVIPLIIEGKDVVGMANTGTGKTAAFLIPLINKILNNNNERVLIVAPTRELAGQIDEEFRYFAQDLRIYSTVCIGGVGMYGQIKRLARQPHFVIATPGRLMDLQRRGALRLDTFTTIVLDEVDQMLDMGFIHDVTQIVRSLPQERHSLFFSATLSPKVGEVMRTFSPNPVIISVKTRDTAAQVDQSVVRLNGRNKVEVLHELLRQEGFDKVLVFLRTKFATDRVARTLSDRGLSVNTIHGNKNQNQRRRALEQFKYDRVGVLLATDVAARGLDIDSVTHVINFDLPETYEDYIHRIGRTGRASKRGAAITLVE